MKFFILATFCIAVAAVVLAADGDGATDDADPVADVLAGRFAWTASPPLLEPKDREGWDLYSVKDPSIVRYDGRWHLFVTVRGKPRSHAIEYVTFTDFDSMDKAERVILPAHAGYWCAPQVFYFTPQKKWYLVCQASSEDWNPKYGPAFSTTDNITDPKSWTAPQRMDCPKTPTGKVGLDFWVICDDAKAHLFFTSLDGRMWRSETRLSDFPAKWSQPVLALKANIFEAAHVYRLAGLEQEKYIAVIEAQGGHGWRYFKAYIADRLDGDWKPLAAEKDPCFASMKNVRQPAGRWTDSISHGELIRAGHDQRLEANPSELRFVFQGVLNKDRARRNYGQIPWRLGVLTFQASEQE